MHRLRAEAEGVKVPRDGWDDQAAVRLRRCAHPKPASPMLSRNDVIYVPSMAWSMQGARTLLGAYNLAFSRAF